MNLVALQKELERVAKELSLSGDFTDSRLVSLKAELDELKLEIAALKLFLEHATPSFTRDFADIREKVFREFNPEIG